MDGIETANASENASRLVAEGREPGPVDGSIKKPRYQSLDIAKGVSVILVVFWHVLQISHTTKLVPNSFYFEINDIPRYIRMPLFFFTSGIVIAHSLNERWKIYFHRRLLQLIWIYILWAAIYHVVQRQPPIELITSLYDAKIHLWFIWGLIIYRVGAKALYRFKKVVIVILSLISVASYSDLPPEVWAIFSGHQHNVITYAFFFFIATWFGRTLVAWIGAHPAATVLGALPVAIGAGLLDIGIIQTVAGVLTGLGLATVIADHVTPLRRLFAFFGRSSLEIFIIHYALVGMLLRALDGLPLANLWVVPIATMVLVGVSILFRRLSDPVAPWLFRPPVWLDRLSSGPYQDELHRPAKL